MRIIYNILFYTFFFITSPYYFLKLWRRGGWRSGFGERFGRYDNKFKQALTNRHVLWIHAVSVGEANLCVQLIRALQPRLPNIKIVVSTTTTTGMKELRRKLPPDISKIYFPIDNRICVARALKIIRPKAVVLVEAEIWPNFLWRLQDRRIPHFLVNARISDRSFRGYRQLGFLFRHLFAGFTGAGAQNEVDARRLLELGCREEAVKVLGSLKFDGLPIEQRHRLDVPLMLRRLGLSEGTPIFLGGSTHNGEEIVLAQMYLRLREHVPSLFLVLVPRHFERGREVGMELERLGLKFVYRSDVGASDPPREAGSLDCLLVNTTGELNFFYEHATVVFVGKSLTSHGGQNPIEPAALGRAMVFGPHMENFAAITNDFLEKNGASQARDAEDLERIVGELLKDEPRRKTMGQNALKVVRENQGAVERTVEMIISGLDIKKMSTGLV